MMKLFFLLVIGLTLSAACSLSQSQAQKKDAQFKPWSEVAGTNTSSEYDEARQIGTITDEALPEVSGIAASRINPGVFWVHNDSGDKARVFAIDEKGKLLAKLKVTEAENIDWEDIETGTGSDGQSALYIADTGNNSLTRDVMTIYRIHEPKLSGEKQAVTEPAEAFPVSYPDGKHDCEAIFINPQNSQIYFVTKTLKGDCGIYRYPLPLRPKEKVVLEKVEGKQSKKITQLRMVTAASTAPDGNRVVIRTYFGAFELQREKGKAFETIFDHEPAIIKVPLLKQAEAICYTADGKSLVTTSEKLPAPLYQITRR